MPFINVGKMPDEEQKVTPAEPLNPQPDPAISASAEPIVPEALVEQAITAESAPVAADDPVATPVEGEAALKPEEINHSQSMAVPTTLPGQEVNIDDDGVKEIKGPPFETIADSAVPADLATPVQATEPAPREPVETVASTTSVEPSTPVESTLPPLVEVSPAVTDSAVSNEPVGSAPVNTQELPPLNEVAPVEKEEQSAASELIVDTTKENNPVAEVQAAPEEIIIKSIDPNTATINEYFDLVLQQNASDLHLSVGYPAFIRLDGILEKIGTTLLEEANVESLLYSVLDENQKKSLLESKEIDFSYEYKEDARFRINAYFEKGHLAAAFRYLPTKIRTIEDLKLPQIVHEFIDISQGFILVTGPTGSGKSTTIASMVQEINEKQKKHILTIEDPIEYVYPKGMSLVDQREMGKDTMSWDNALRAALRQDPNVVVVGEMRDFETIAAAITVAETGHLVFATLHTNTAVQTIDRIIDVFPQHQQSQVRSQLANVMSAVISQRLIPVRSGGRRAVAEVMIGTSAVKNAIREGKTYQIDNIIQTSFDVGMITLERALVDLIREGELTIEEAQQHTTRPEELVRLMKKA